MNGDLCGEQGWYGEETLDVEAVHAMAPGANVLYVAGRSCDDPDLLAALNKIVDNHLADIISNSWGGVGEPDPATQARARCRRTPRPSCRRPLEGIGVFFSSGDNGDESPERGRPRRSTSRPPHPLVTAVGGTSLAVGQEQHLPVRDRLGHQEVRADRRRVGPDASRQLPVRGRWRHQPVCSPSRAYQKGVVPSSIANYFKGGPGRAVPDIAADADPNTGMLVGETQTFPDGTVKYGEYRIGGTSLACPLIAGIEALADQAAGHPHGFANPAIYQLAGSSAVRDVVPHGNKLAVVRVDFANGVDAADGLIYSLRSIDRTGTIQTRKGYDDVTGVGTPYGPRYVFALGH